MESVMMSDKEWQSYVCFLPLVEETKTVRSIALQNSSNALLESDRRIKLFDPEVTAAFSQNHSDVSQRMFQQERPTRHTIHCNEMPRDIKDSPVEDRLKGTQITTITDDTGRHAASS